MIYTTDYIMSQVKLRTGLNASLITDAQLIEIINEEMIKIASWVMDSKKEYFIFPYDFSFSSENKYKIPKNAIGKKVRDVVFVRSNNFINIPIIQFDNLTNYYGYTGYYILDNYLHIYPKETTFSEYLRVYYFRRPAEFVLSGESGVIQTVNTTNVILASAIAEWDTDKYGPGFGTIQFDVMDKDDKSVVKIAGRTGTRTSGSATITIDTTSIVAGDIIMPSGFSAYSQFPKEINPLLIQSVCNIIFDILNDDKNLAKGVMILNKMFSDFSVLISPRDESDGQIITSNRSMRNYV